MSSERPRGSWLPLVFVVGCPLLWSVLAYFRFGDTDTLYTAWRGGAAIPALALHEPWRIITAPLLHVDPIHLGFNVALLAVVVLMTRRVTHFPLLLVAALSAWTATAAGVLARPGWALGASAAFYGLVGGVAAGAMRERTQRPLAGKILVVAFVAIALGPGDQPAHLIGLVTGAVFAYLPHTGAVARGLHGGVFAILVAGMAFGAFHSDDPPARWQSVTTGGAGLSVPEQWVPAAAVGPCAEVYTDGLRSACALSPDEVNALPERLKNMGFASVEGADAFNGRAVRRWTRVVGDGTLLEGSPDSRGQTVLLTTGSAGGLASWLVPERFSP